MKFEFGLVASIIISILFISGCITTPTTNSIEITNNSDNITIPNNCIEEWDCTDWTPEACGESGQQTRKCTDINDCGTNESIPLKSIECIYNPPRGVMH